MDGEAEEALATIEAAAGMYASLLMALLERLSARGVIDRSDFDALTNDVIGFSSQIGLPAGAEQHRILLLKAIASMSALQDQRRKSEGDA